MYGHEFDLMDPQGADVDIQDIAHALSRIQRWGGHTIQPHSVAIHSIHCQEIAKSWGFGADYQMWALMHDGAEAYIGDIVHPFKRNLATVLDAEIKIETAIGEALIPGGKLMTGGMVKNFDEFSSAVEQIHPNIRGLARTLPGYERYAVDMCNAIDFNVWTWEARQSAEKARLDFLRRYFGLKEILNKSDPE